MYQTRVEKDDLGAKELPAYAYYGIETIRAVENLPFIGCKLPTEFIQAMAMVKKVAAKVNIEMNQMDPSVGKLIIRVAQEIMDGRWHESFIVNPFHGRAAESFNINMNEVIANRAIELLGENKGDYVTVSPNTHVNMLQSSNGSFTTAIYMATLFLIRKLLDTMNELHITFQKKAKQCDGNLKMERNHLQDGVTFRLRQELLTYSQILKRDMKQISETQNYLYKVNMRVVGTEHNTQYIKRVMELFTEESGFPLESAEHLVDASIDTNTYKEVSAALKVSMINMSKVATALRLIASDPLDGLGNSRLPIGQRDSIMPDKVICEIINLVAIQVMGNDHNVCLASEAGRLEPNVMEPLLAYNLFQSLNMMNQVCTLFRSC